MEGFWDLIASLCSRSDVEKIRTGYLGSFSKSGISLWVGNLLKGLREKISLIEQNPRHSRRQMMAYVERNL